MSSVPAIATFTLALGLLGGCSSDEETTGSGGTSSGGSAAGTSAGGGGAGQAGSTTVSDPSDCDAVGAQQKARITALGCKDTSATIAAGCRALYAGDLCTTEWESLLACISPRPSSDFECDADDELAPKTGICTAERATFDGCIGN
jgi:hypothetical protein